MKRTVTVSNREAWMKRMVKLGRYIELLTAFGWVFLMRSPFTCS